MAFFLTIFHQNNILKSSTILQFFFKQANKIVDKFFEGVWRYVSFI